MPKEHIPKTETWGWDLPPEPDSDEVRKHRITEEEKTERVFLMSGAVVLCTLLLVLAVLAL